MPSGDTYLRLAYRERSRSYPWLQHNNFSGAAEAGITSEVIDGSSHNRPSR